MSATNGRADEKSWTDQPEAVLGKPVILSFFTHGRSIEVRDAGDGTYLVSQGNLFGSQTLACESGAVAFEVLNVIANARDHFPPVKCPPGATLLDPPTKETPCASGSQAPSAG